MSYLPEGKVPPTYGPFVTLEQRLGFVPRLFRAQTLLPRVIEAEAGIAAAVLLQPAGLSRIQKESILLAVAAASRNAYCVTAHARMLRDLEVPEARVARMVKDHRQAGLEAPDVALLNYALKV
jgi:AhpD family alkylhydroperoxidase